jgi:hypothetical protein
LREAEATRNKGASQLNDQDISSSSTSDRGICAALIFALVAERLSVYYEHEIRITQAQGATLAADWLSRSKRNMPLAMRLHLSEISDQLANQITASVSREAGLYISHELQESLDPRYQSDIGKSIMVECERMLEES